MNAVTESMHSPEYTTGKSFYDSLELISERSLSAQNNGDGYSDYKLFIFSDLDLDGDVWRDYTDIAYMGIDLENVSVYVIVLACEYRTTPCMAEKSRWEWEFMGDTPSEDGEDVDERFNAKEFHFLTREDPIVTKLNEFMTGPEP